MPWTSRSAKLRRVVHRTTSVRCLIVDDSANFRDAASRMLELAGIAVVGVATTAAEALTRYRELRPDVTLVDVDLGADSGFELAHTLHTADSPAPSVILISTHSEHDFADMIADSPALGFLPRFALSPVAVRELVGGRA